MMPLPRHTTWIDDTEKGTNVFVPGIMSAGVLLSLGIVIADFVNKVRGDEGARRQRELVASYVTGDVLRSIHREEEIPVEAGLRSRRTYFLLAFFFVGLGIYGFIGSFWNYINPIDDGWVEDIGWVFSVSLIAVTGLLSVGFVLLWIVFRYPDIPSWARPFVARTPIGSAPDPD